MKTLNEQLYERLLQEKRPVTVPEISSSEAFENVPRFLVGKGLLALCGEGLINYYMKDGKIYFTTDLSIGRGPIASVSNINNLTDALSALLGKADEDKSSFLSNMVKAFPEEGDDAVDKRLDSLVFETKLNGDDFELAFPKHNTQDVEIGVEHELMVTYEDLMIASMTTRVMAVDVDCSETAMKASIQSFCANYIKKIYKCLNVPEEYTGNNVIAFYLPAAPNCFAFVARPDGIHILRVDWNFDGKLPSKKAVCNFFEKWLSTYKYLGKKQYFKILPFDREELLRDPVSKDVENKLLEEFENYLNDANRQINMIKGSAGLDEGTNKPTIFFIRARKSLEEAAGIADEVIVQATNVINYYKTKKTSEDFITKLYILSQVTLDVASNINTTIKVNVNNIPYYSATDIAVGTSSAEDQTVRVFPSKYLDFLELITTQRISEQKLDEESQKNIIAFRKEMKARFDIANTLPIYYPDYIFEGKMLAAYLGHDEEIVVPEFVTSIGSYAFKSVKELKKITLGENVEVIEFAPFEGCSNLKTIKVLGDISSIQGPIMGLVSPTKITVQGYSNTYIQKYCKGNDIAFEIIKEDNLDCVIGLAKGEYDLYQGFALPKIVGYKTTLELNSAEKKKVASDEDTMHIRYGMVPGDRVFADYKDSRFSITVVQDALDIPKGGIQIAEEIESRFNQQTVHNVYRTVKADQGKVLVRYDMTREGIDNDVRWATYIVVIAREEKIVVAQVFFNGKFSHRQQEYAINKWTSQILLEKSYQESQKKLLESKSKTEKANERADKILVKVSAQEYLTKSETKLRSFKRDWEAFTSEVPDKLMRLVRSGIKPTISSNSSGNQIGVSLNFESNMDAAKQYVEQVREKMESKSDEIEKQIIDIDKNLQIYLDAGIDADLLKKLIRNLMDWIAYIPNMSFRIRGDQTIDFEVSDKTIALKKKWEKELAKLNDSSYSVHKVIPETKMQMEKPKRVEKTVTLEAQEWKVYSFIKYRHDGWERKNLIRDKFQHIQDWEKVLDSLCKKEVLSLKEDGNELYNKVYSLCNHHIWEVREETEDEKYRRIEKEKIEEKQKMLSQLKVAPEEKKRMEKTVALEAQEWKVYSFIKYRHDGWERKNLIRDKFQHIKGWEKILDSLCKKEVLSLKEDGDELYNKVYSLRNHHIWEVREETEIEKKQKVLAQLEIMSDLEYSILSFIQKSDVPLSSDQILEHYNSENKDTVLKTLLSAVNKELLEERDGNYYTSRKKELPIDEKRLQNAEKALEEKWEAERKYAQVLAEWKQKIVEVDKQREQKLSEQLEVYRNSFQSELEKKLAIIAEHKQKREQLKAKQSSKQQELGMLGFFKFKAKKELREEISQISLEIAEVSEKIVLAESSYRTMEDYVEDQVKEKRSELQWKVEADYPYPEEPQK